MAERKNLVLRIDPALWAEIEKWAQDELRSVNGQIEYLLKQAVVARRRRTKDQWEGPGDDAP
ncbi:MAG: Arc family DNA-binding protein [Tepidisphaeraceae bacterium]